MKNEKEIEYLEKKIERVEKGIDWVWWSLIVTVTVTVLVVLKRIL